MHAVLLAGQPNTQIMVALAMGMALACGLFFMMVVLAAKYYKRCPSNRILVVFGRAGLEDNCQCVHGGAKFVVPLIQDYRWLSLDAIRVEVTGPAATDELAERLFLPNVFNVAVGTEPDLMRHAAKHLLDQTADEIRQLAEDSIVSRLDHTLAEQRSRPSDDGPAVIDSLNEAVESNLNQIGLTVLNSRRT